MISVALILVFHFFKSRLFLLDPRDSDKPVALVCVASWYEQAREGNFSPSNIYSQGE
jgi:hypothetical protein